MKKIMIIVAMTVCCMATSAQNEIGQFTLQPKVGLNLSHITNTEVPVCSFTDEKEEGKFKGDFVVGVEAEYGLAKQFSVAAAILYSRQGTDFGKNYIYGNSDGSATEGWDRNRRNLDYLNIPIVGNFYIVKGLAIKAGIQPGFLLRANMKIDGVGTTKSVDITSKDDSKTFDLSIPLGISYQFDNIVIDGRYNLGLTKVNKYGDEKSKNGVIQITVGYKFAL